MTNRNLINQYICPSCEKSLFTIDLIEGGVTPFMIRCVYCKSDMMQSMFYRCKQDESLVTHEWYRPDKGAMQRLSSEVREHIKKGGLILRKKTK